MTPLDHARLRAVLDASAEIAAAPDLAALRTTAVASFGSLIGHDLISYNEISPGRPPLVVAGPGGELDAGDAEVFGALIPENPLVAHFAATGDGSARRISDFLGDRELRQLDLHRQIYRRIGVNYQAAVSTRAARDTIVGLAVSRAASDFDDGDIAVLELLRPHLVAAHRKLTEIEWLGRMLDAVGDAEAKESVVLVDCDGRMLRTTAGAARLLGCEPPQQLPSPLLEWLREAGDRADPAVVTVTVPGGSGEMMRAHLHPGADATHVISLAPAAPDAVRLAALELGLTRREAELVTLLCGGHGTVDAAAALRISTRTVGKHLENTFRKLDVTDRAGAMRVVLGATRR